MTLMIFSAQLELGTAQTAHLHFLALGLQTPSLIGRSQRLHLTWLLNVMWGIQECWKILKTFHC